MYTWDDIIKQYENSNLPEDEKQGEMFWVYIKGKLDKLLAEGKFDLEVKGYNFKRITGPFRTLRWLESLDHYSEGYLGEEYKKLEANLHFKIWVTTEDILERCNKDSTKFEKEKIIDELKLIMSHGAEIELEDELRKVEFGKEITDPKIIKFLERLEKAVDDAYKRNGETRGEDDSIPSFLKHTSPHSLIAKELRDREGKIEVDYELRLVGWDAPVQPGDTDRRIAALTRLGVLAYDKTRSSSECINFFNPDGACEECPRVIECEIDYKVENGLEDEIDGYWDNYEDDYEDDLNKNYW